MSELMGLFILIGIIYLIAMIACFICTWDLHNQLKEFLWGNDDD